MTQNNNKTIKPRGFQLAPENINREGRPKKELSMTNALREILLEQNPETKIERYKELLQVALNKAMKGDGDMLKYLINRIEGLPKGSDTNINVEKAVIPIYGGLSVQGHHGNQEDI